MSNNATAPPVKKSKESRRADDKSVEHVLRALSSLQTPEEKLAAMCKKYTEMVEESRKLGAGSRQWEKRCALLQREKEQIQAEYNKAVLVKAKLENLCRELQRQNKAIKEETAIKFRDEEERRRETQAKFQTTLTEITALMQQNNEKNSKLRDDNLDMTKKFISVVEQYDLREQQIDKLGKQMSLEQQLAEAKLNKAQLETQAERERGLAEKKHLMMELAQYQARCAEMQSTETALRCQLAVYTDKYDEFQNALTKSNEVFGGFKGEMEKMSKKILKLEKETSVWKQRWEKSHAALLDMAADKQQRDTSTALQARQLSQLQRLCRTMQAERSTLLSTLQEHNIERPPLPQLPPEPEIIPPSNSMDKVDAMAANCAQLKQSLAQLQGQLNVLSAKGVAATENGAPKEESPAPEQAGNTAQQKSKPKKGKGKKGKQGNTKDAETEAAQGTENKTDAETLSVTSDETSINAVSDVQTTVLDSSSSNLSIVEIATMSPDAVETVLTNIDAEETPIPEIAMLPISDVDCLPIVEHAPPQIADVAPLPVVKHAPPQIADVAPLPVVKHAPPQIADVAPLPVVKHAPPQMADVAPLPVVKHAPPQIADVAPLPVVKHAPPQMADVAPLPVVKHAPPQIADMAPLPVVKHAPPQMADVAPLPAVDEVAQNIKREEGITKDSLLKNEVNLLENVNVTSILDSIVKNIILENKSNSASASCSATDVAAAEAAAPVAAETAAEVAVKEKADPVAAPPLQSNPLTSF